MTATAILTCGNQYHHLMNNAAAPQGTTLWQQRTVAPASNDNVFCLPTITTAAEPCSQQCNAGAATTIKAQVRCLEDDEYETELATNYGSNSAVETIKQRRNGFCGMREEEIQKKTLPDHLAEELDILMIGINPGLISAYKGHYYAGPGNHFWKCLFLSGLVPKPLTSEDDYKLIEHGIGFTNIVPRTTRSSSDLKTKEIRDGAKILLEKIQRYKPKIAVFNGKEIYRIFSGQQEFPFGLQTESINGTTLYVMPSSSARGSQLTRAVDKVPFYVGLRKLRDRINLANQNGMLRPTTQLSSALPKSLQNPKNIITGPTANNQSSKRRDHKKCTKDDDDDAPEIVDPKTSLESTSHRAFLELDFCAKVDAFDAREDDSDDNLAKASSSRQSERNCLFEEAMPNNKINPVVPFYHLPESGDVSAVSDSSKQTPSSAGQTSTANDQQQQQTYSDGQYQGSDSAGQQQIQQQQSGYPAAGHLPMGYGSGALKTFGEPAAARSNDGFGSVYNMNMQTGFVQFGEINGQSNCNGENHQSVSNEDSHPNVQSQQAQSTDESTNGPVISATSSNSATPVTATTTFTNQLGAGAGATQSMTSMSNDDINKLYASILNAANASSANNGNSSPAIDSNSLNMFQLQQDYRANESSDQIPSDHLLMQPQQPMQNQYVNMQQQHQQLTQMQQQHMQQRFLGNGSDNMHPHQQQTDQQSRMPTLAKNEPTTMIGQRQIPSAVAAVIAEKSGKKCALSPDIVQHVEEAIEAVVQRARDGPLDMPVMRQSAKHARAFRTQPEKAAAAASAAAAQNQLHQQQQHHHQQQQQMQQQQQHAQQQAQQHQQQQQQVQHNQQILNLQMQAVAAQFDLGRSMKNTQDNTAAVAAALLGAQGAYDQNCQSGASLYSQYFQQQQTQQQQPGGGASNQFATPFITTSNAAGGYGATAAAPQWSATPFSTTASQPTAVATATPVYASHPMTAATYFQTPLYHQNAAAAALAPYFQMNVNPATAQQQAMYGQYAAVAGSGFTLQQQQQQQQSPHNL